MTARRTPLEQMHHERILALNCVLGVTHGHECRGRTTVQHLQGLAERGLGQKSDHMRVIPLCWNHHLGNGAGSSHCAIDLMGMEAWEVKYGKQAYHLDVTREILRLVCPDWDAVTGERL